MNLQEALARTHAAIEFQREADNERCVMAVIFSMSWRQPKCADNLRSRARAQLEDSGRVPPAG